MAITASQVAVLKNAVTEAKRVGLHRLAALLDSVATIGEMLHDHGHLTSADVADIELDDLVEHGSRVARDILRTPSAA